MYTEDYCNNFYESLIELSPIYVWGANLQKATPELFDTLYKSYGSTKYNQQYYNDKRNEAMAGSGWVSDCSGMLFPISDKDRTAQGYYNDSRSKGNISSIDLNHSCLVFRGDSTASIKHVGYYNAKNRCVQEMASSTTNFQNKVFNPANWTYWGKPSFIDYSSPIVVPPSTGAKPYKYKGIDISSYQKNVNYQALKQAGVDFAILKIINKQGNIDSQYNLHAQSLDAVGIDVKGVYNYSYATDVDKAIYDANRVLHYIGNRQCAVYLDVEDDCQKRLGAGLIDIINAYQNVIEASGRAFGLYTGLSFFNSYIKPYQSGLKTKNFWIGRYYQSYTPMQFEEDPNQSYKPMDNIVAWQYTSSGQVNGISGGVDLNVMYKDIAKPTSVPSVVIPQNPQNSPQITTEIKNTVNTNGANLNIRNKPNANGQIVGKLKNKQEITIVGVDHTTGWYRLTVTEEYWVSCNYVASTGKGKITAENSVYIRSSDSVSGQIWGVYRNGEIVTILHQSTNTGWYLTPKGWVSNNYLERI